MSDWTPSAHELERRRLRRSLQTRSALIATAMTVAVFVVAGLVITGSPGWASVKTLFFSWDDAREALPDIWDAIWLNIKMFLVAEVFILIFAMLIAMTRVSQSPWLMPLRIVAVVYTDVVRGIPTILLVYLLAFGMPALRLEGLPNGAFFWATVALIVSYSAYVAEVFRSGIESVHPSQWASAEALGLSRGQTLRHVVIPQAVRRVDPAAPQRLRLAAEGHRPRVRRRRVRGGVRGPRLRQLQLQLHAAGRRSLLLHRADRAAGPALRLADRADAAP